MLIFICQHLFSCGCWMLKWRDRFNINIASSLAPTVIFYYIICIQATVKQLPNTSASIHAVTVSQASVTVSHTLPLTPPVFLSISLCYLKISTLVNFNSDIKLFSVLVERNRTWLIFSRIWQKNSSPHASSVITVTNHKHLFGVTNRDKFF